MPFCRSQQKTDSNKCYKLTVGRTIVGTCSNKLLYRSDESVWDFEFGIGIGIFPPKYRGIGIGFGIKIGMKSV